VQVFNLHETIAGVVFPQVKNLRPLLGPAVTHGGSCLEWVQVFNLHETIAGVVFPQVNPSYALRNHFSDFWAVRRS